jgi:hypothetical protein
MKQYRTSYRKSSPVKVTKADGTVTILPALKREELFAFLQKSGNIKIKKKKNKK